MSTWLFTIQNDKTNETICCLFCCWIFYLFFFFSFCVVLSCHLQFIQHEWTLYGFQWLSFIVVAIKHRQFDSMKKNKRSTTKITILHCFFLFSFYLFKWCTIIIIIMLNVWHFICVFKRQTTMTIVKCR